jgi:hypothetical protein
VSEVHFNWRKLRDPHQERADNKAWRSQLTAMVLEDEECREDGRRLCKTHLLALCYVLGYCLITEDVHHEALNYFPEVDDNRTVEELCVGVKRRRSLMYPRNTYKSTIDLVNVVRLILNYYFTIAILIMSGGKELAFAFVDQIASFFVRPDNRPMTLFQALFPELCITRQKNSGEFTAALRKSEPKIIEPLVWANSIDSATTGWHPDVLILDDVNNNRNSNSFTARVRITKAYKLSRKILKPTGIEMLIGTPYGPGDLFNDQLLTARPGSYDRVFKPAMKMLSGERLDANGFPAEDEVELLFPSILSYDFLREEYEADYASFQSQYMLDSYGASEIVFGERETLEAMVDEGDLPMEGETFMALRLPCRSQKWDKVSGAVGLMHRNRMYVVDIVQGHYKPSVMAKMIHDLARKHGLHRVAIEDSPGARIFQPAIDNYALSTGWPVRIEWLPFIEDAGERDIRIRSMEALIATSRLLFSSGVKTKPLMTGFVEYGMTPETGLPDVISRLADHLPVSIANEEEDSEDAWEMLRQRDHFNLVYGRGPYAPPEPEPEEAEPEPYIEDQEFTSTGLQVCIPGLEY